MVFCIKCGTHIADEDQYCHHCGYVKTTQRGSTPHSQRGLIHTLKTRTDKAIKKGLEVGVQTSEELLDLSKKGVKKVKDAVDPETDPLTIVKIRYAKGESTQDEYEALTQALQVTS
jgi:hypothetical protein